LTVDRFKKKKEILFPYFYNMSRSGSEAIAKALKGGGLSSVEKIKKAREAWNNNSLFFPNKDDFLFTWLCSSFAKPNMKK
jgi:hypothetical protein